MTRKNCSGTETEQREIENADTRTPLRNKQCQEKYNDDQQLICVNRTTASTVNSNLTYTWPQRNKHIYKEQIGRKKDTCRQQLLCTRMNIVHG